MTIRIGPHEFDRVTYDETGDVLYLARGDAQEAEQTVATPEGHAVRFDPDGDVIGITLVNVKWLARSGERVIITVPERLEADPEDLAAALAK